MNVDEKYSYKVSPYKEIKDEAREVSKAFLDGNRYLDSAKEYVYIEEGMPYLSEAIHYEAHKCLERLDTFGELLHERHLMQEYPTTLELDIKGEIENVDGVFDLVTRVLEYIGEALEKFHQKTDTALLRPMAIKVEELMLENSRDYTMFLQAWKRWGVDGGSKTSFESFCREYLGIKE